MRDGHAVYMHDSDVWQTHTGAVMRQQPKGAAVVQQLPQWEATPQQDPLVGKKRKTRWMLLLCCHLSGLCFISFLGGFGASWYSVLDCMCLWQQSLCQSRLQSILLLAWS